MWLGPDAREVPVLTCRAVLADLDLHDPCFPVPGIDHEEAWPGGLAQNELDGLGGLDGTDDGW